MKMTASKIQILPPHPVNINNSTNLNNTIPPINRINNNNTNSQISGTRRCLFGAPDPVETKMISTRIYKRQFKECQRRYIERFGFDIQTEELIEDKDVQSRLRGIENRQDNDDMNDEELNEDSNNHVCNNSDRNMMSMKSVSPSKRRRNAHSVQPYTTREQKQIAGLWKTKNTPAEPSEKL